MKDKGTIVIQFGTLPEQIEVNIATFTPPKTFEVKEGQQEPSDAKSEALKEGDCHDLKTYCSYTQVQEVVEVVNW